MVARRRQFDEHWQRLLFRDYLVANPQAAQEYAQLKADLAATHANDRVAYTNGKTDFIQRITAQARKARDVA
jgi:GrpB-like predicted nucleotidyltransferase (UPF0157 family)